MIQEQRAICQVQTEASIRPIVQATGRYKRPRSENPPVSARDRQRQCRARKRQRALADITNTVPTRPEEGDLRCRDPEMLNYWAAASLRFNKIFMSNKFGFACSVCDRLWFQSDLTRVDDKCLDLLEAEFGEPCLDFVVCSNCNKNLRLNRIPTNCTTNGFRYPEAPQGLPPLDPISARLISPRIPFVDIRRLTRDGQFRIRGQVINMPMDVDTMVRSLPRRLDDDYAFNVAFKRRLIHKSVFLSGFVRKRTIRDWLIHLVQQPLYRFYKITIDQEFLTEVSSASSDPSIPADQVDLIEELEDNGIQNEELISRQHTLLWNEENCLEIAPARGARPLNIIYDEYAEELSFPAIYHGTARFFKPGIHVTPYMISNSEIRRRDRRGAIPEHILYMAMKILRLRVVDGIRSSFRCVRETENITARMLGDSRFMEECIEKDFAFLKSIPNSVNYWQARKKDLFAMMRQLGKPTVFLTMSASEMNWLDLLALLWKLRHKGARASDEEIAALDRFARGDLINEDPATCSLYFEKLVSTIMNMLKSKTTYNPLGKYRVIDFFMRIEFQHRGSPHAHVLLWLEKDPREPISEWMPQTIQLINDLCSVSESDLASGMYSNQVHKHTFTCVKNGQSSCRFNIPYWPMTFTRVLLPLRDDHGERAILKSKAKLLRASLESKVYESIETFFADHNLTESLYLNCVRSTLTRPTVCFRRNMTEIMTNTFHPWIASTLNSNMDIQFILDEYSCASYVVDYVNKSNRGLSHLHRELLKLAEQNPEMTQIQLMKEMGKKLINTIEMSAQEAAWYLLRLHMSECSRDCVYIPTCMPSERMKAHKTQRQLREEFVDQDSTDIWTKSIMQHYEDRPEELSGVCLADFAAKYGPDTKRPRDSDEDPQESRGSLKRDRTYHRREFNKIIRYRHYEPSDVSNYKRELVTLYIPFRNELKDILDRGKFLSLYDSEMERIAAKRAEYESGMNIIKLLEQMKKQDANEGSRLDEMVNSREAFARTILTDREPENFDDFEAGCSGVVTAITKRLNVLPKADYCSLMRTTNSRQRELVLEFIHRLNSPNPDPIQIFFTGPAGCGKTYVLKLIMETLNRYKPSNSGANNSYMACASTGKAAVNIDGTTVHSAFHLTLSMCKSQIHAQRLPAFQRQFVDVKCVIIDEVSMIGSDLLHRVDQRLVQITGRQVVSSTCARSPPDTTRHFGHMNIIFCGDFRQLPPVRATPVYKGSLNHIEGASLWQSLDYFPLEQVMRQTNVEFSSILTKIGNGLPLQDDEKRLIESRFRSYQWCEENLAGVVRLFHMNHKVSDFNRSAMRNAEDLLAQDLMQGYSNQNEMASARAKLHKMNVMQTNGLPYNLLMAIGHPYMITANIAIDDGLVNGAVGILRHAEKCIHSSDCEPSISRLWLEFPDTRTGMLARTRFRSVMLNSNGVINRKWTPILKRSARINLGGAVSCGRTQFSIFPACAMTIHKSQGGTFERIVVEYSKTQSSSLVYVALSRVTSIDGLYLTNSDGDFKFHHSRGSNEPSIREIRDEYSRLESHRLETLTDTILRFIIPEENRFSIIVCTINAQSLVAHEKDISTDRVIGKSDILAITETWMDPDTPVSIDGFVLISSSSESCINDTAVISENSTTTRRKAGGVAFYLNSNSSLTCRSVPRDINSTGDAQLSHVADISLVELQYDLAKLIVGVVYIHPQASKASVEAFLSQALKNYSISVQELNLTGEPDRQTPMIITGDFNINVSKDGSLIEFMQREFGLMYICNSQPTTLNSTTIDLTFLRGLVGSCIPFVSYFSDHRPLFNKVFLT